MATHRLLLRTQGYDKCIQVWGTGRNEPPHPGPAKHWIYWTLDQQGASFAVELDPYDDFKDPDGKVSIPGWLGIGWSPVAPDHHPPQVRRVPFHRPWGAIKRSLTGEVDNSTTRAAAVCCELLCAQLTRQLSVRRGVMANAALRRATLRPCNPVLPCVHPFEAAVSACTAVAVELLVHSGQSRHGGTGWLRTLSAVTCQQQSFVPALSKHSVVISRV